MSYWVGEIKERSVERNYYAYTKRGRSTKNLFTARLNFLFTASEQSYYKSSQIDRRHEYTCSISLADKISHNIQREEALCLFYLIHHKAFAELAHKS